MPHRMIKTDDALSSFEELALRQSPDAVIVTTQLGEVVHWNKGAQEIFLYADTEAIGRNLKSLIIPPDRMQEEDRHFTETLASGSVTFEAFRHRKDGSLVYVDVTSKLVIEKSETYVLFTTKDVTHLKVLRDTKQVEARFRDLLESTPDGIVMANPSGHIVFANTYAERLFGYASGELLGKPVETLLPTRFHGA